jgi:serine/threonine protein kinase
MTTEPSKESPISSEYMLRDILDEQVRMDRVTEDNEDERPPLPSLSAIGEDLAGTPEFVALHIPRYQSYKTLFGHNPSSTYINYIWTNNSGSALPSIGKARIPYGVESCKKTLISCTIDASSWRSIELLRWLFKEGYVTAQFDPSFPNVGQFPDLPIRDIRMRTTSTSTASVRQFGTSQFPSSVPQGTSRPTSSASSIMSFMTARSEISFASSRSTYSNSTFYSIATMIETIREDETPDSELSAPLAQLHQDYYTTLRQQNLIQPLSKELNWSEKGQHVTFAPGDEIPLRSVSHLGSSNAATVDKVICRRIALARKTMRCNKRWTVADASREAYHLQNFRHFHIVQLVGTYLQGRNFSILMYPVADSHLGIFLEETCDMVASREMDLWYRRRFLASSLGCLAAAIAFIHKKTTKHMDIKPQNILVRYVKPHPSDKWRIYVADFGLSRSFGSQDHSQTDGPTSRTPRYCSPEVYNDEGRGRPADIFSLGCVFLEIICVLEGKDLQDFADARRGSSGDESFHGNLQKVVEWARNSLSCQLLPKTFFWNDDLAAFKLIVEMVIGMLSRDPSERPTAAQICKLIAGLPKSSFLPCPNCSMPPEPYERYEANEISDKRVARVLLPMP